MNFTDKYPPIYVSMGLSENRVVGSSFAYASTTKFFDTKNYSPRKNQSFDF